MKMVDEPGKSGKVPWVELNAPEIL